MNKNKYAGNYQPATHASSHLAEWNAIFPFTLSLHICLDLSIFPLFSTIICEFLRILRHVNQILKRFRCASLQMPFGKCPHRMSLSSQTSLFIVPTEGRGQKVRFFFFHKLNLVNLKGKRRECNFCTIGGFFPRATTIHVV